ncbi:hypothetical protein ABW20_dc0103217 [Dactylellina cionopaga]|nr:hypothetical protein ABW20_dc0103217 [Dactylellina cionopaga]
MANIGCYCAALLKQPQEKPTGVTVADYQRAIDSMPEYTKMHNKDWVWSPKWGFGKNGEPGFTMTFSKHRVNVQDNDPTLKEPYFIEGPDLHINLEGNFEQTLEWLQSLWKLGGTAYRFALDRLGQRYNPGRRRKPIVKRAAAETEEVQPPNNAAEKI